MKRLRSAFACVALYALTVAPGAAEKQPVVVVRGPTVVAFFELVPQAKLNKDPDTNESLADFQLYATSVREPLRKEGIEFHELYAHSFRLRIGSKLTTFRPAKVDVGYYLVAPGKKPRIEYGVMTDSGLLQVANAYFGIHSERR
jgi:PP-loop superfamily ATP-utilizing enzyme